MRYLSVTEIAKKWDVSERSVRNYCAQGRVNGAFLTGKTWNIPENVEKPERSNKKKEQPITLLDILQEQKASKYSGGIYHKTQIELTYNSNHIEGSRLTHDQTRYIFETNTIGVEKDVLNVDDVIETANHFRCIDMIIDNAISLNDSNILILGYGDLGKQLANLLKKQYIVTICNRNYKDYDQIIQNYKHIDFVNLKGTYDLIINTIPCAVINYQNVSYQKIIDLAQTLHLKNYQSIRNVPERSFPYEAALIMYFAIQEVMNHV